MPKSRTERMLDQIAENDLSLVEGSGAFIVMVHELMELGHTRLEAREIASDVLRPL